ncbi:efflux RND transporter periplasmic adaptor subunit [Methylicorpusculum sp.]|uniref:efflux RND transporter periplasmic adaptor subunit n=1 Tax=Methylicorpusculum sp. TaxID=2713644 RepID=UPI002ABB8438|nr:efflux RND transporter periplasmic adaptor subunit [Methylicorpusculum sp.]MDZ4153990.1 efflux RND transporter periplasmic adaptor subunit [Methylicorpusculum sp.]
MKLVKTLALTLNLIVLNSVADEIAPARETVPETIAPAVSAPAPLKEAGKETRQIVISQTQIQALGIKTGQLIPVQEIPLLQVAAKAIIPPNKENWVSAAQGGLITKIAVALGDKVSQGQLLAQINSPELLNLQRQYLKAGNELRLAESVFQRDKKMADSGIIANSRLQESRSRYDSLSAETNEARQLLRLTGMTEVAIKQLETTRQLNSLLNVVAPISGVVLENKTTTGSRVDNQTALFLIADLTELWLELSIPQEKINTIHLGDKVTITDSEVTAKISLLGQSVNDQNQTITARAVIQAPQNEVRPGQSLQVNVIKVLEQPAIKLPNEAIAQHQDQAFIFIKNEQGFLVSPVQIIGKQESESFISSHLPAQSVVALSGAAALKANWLGLGDAD